MTGSLDCLVLGYDDDTPRQFARLAAAEPGSVEHRSYLRNQALIDGVPHTYPDVLNHAMARTPRWIGRGQAPLYHVGEVSNLAAVYLSSYLIARGFSAQPISLVGAELDDVVACLEDERPAVVAITTTFYEDVTTVAGLTELVQRHHPGAVIVVGGPLVQNLRHDLDADAFDDALVTMGADVYVNEAEGEATLLELIRAVRSGRALADVPNLLFRSSGGYRATPAQREQNILDECSIDWSRFERTIVGRTVQTRTARSCAYHCAFCDYPIRAGRLSVASVEVVERELETLARLGVENVVFVDDTFNVPEERFRELCRMMIRRDFGFRWFSYFRCGSVRKPDTFDLMRSSGCEGVFLGIESGDPVVLRNMAKSSTIDQYQRGIEALHRNDILTFASFISGFPGETERSLANTVDFINATGPTLYRVEPWWYNHRSPVFQRASEFALSGRAFDWRHATMSAAEACDGIDFIFQNVRSSWWCPQQSFSFWGLPYLMGKGMTRAQVVEFHRLLHARLPRSTQAFAAGTGRDAEDGLDPLRTLVPQLQLRDPRWVRRASSANDPLHGAGAALAG